MTINNSMPLTSNISVISPKDPTNSQVKVNEIPIGDQFRFLTKSRSGDKNHPIDLGQEYNVTVISSDMVGHGKLDNYLDLCKRKLLTNSMLLELPKLALEAILNSNGGLSDKELTFYIPENIQVQFLSNNEVKGILKAASDLQDDYKNPNPCFKTKYNKGFIKCTNAYSVGKILEKIKQAVNLDDPDLNALIDKFLTLKKEATLKAAVKDLYALRLKFKMEEETHSVTGPKLTFEKDLTEMVNRGSKRKGYETVLGSSKFPHFAAQQVNPASVQTSKKLNPHLYNVNEEIAFENEMKSLNELFNQDSISTYVSKWNTLTGAEKLGLPIRALAEIDDSINGLSKPKILPYLLESDFPNEYEPPEQYNRHSFFKLANVFVIGKLLDRIKKESNLEDVELNSLINKMTHTNRLDRLRVPEALTMLRAIQTRLLPRIEAISDNRFDTSQVTTEIAEYPQLMPENEEYLQLNFGPGNDFDPSQVTSETAEYPQLMPENEEYLQLNFGNDEENPFNDPFFAGLL